MILNTITWILNALLLASIIHSIYMKRKTKKILDKIIQKNAETDKYNEEFIALYNERANLLSRENYKMSQQNEMLKDRLRNMGIKDFDVI